MKRGRKGTSAAHKSATKQALAAIEDSRILGFVPYGQVAVNNKQAERKKWLALQEKNEWPSDIPSFELWAKMTAYDTPEHFQRIMASMLGDPVNATKKEQVPSKALGDSDYYTLDGTGDCFGVPPANYQYQAKRDGIIKVVHCAPTCGPLTDSWGVTSGAYSGKVSGFPKAKAFETNPSYTVYSQIDWRMKFNLRTGPEGNPGKAQSGANIFFTDGTAKAQQAHCQESGGIGLSGDPDGLSCMSLGNSFAAIYGLYYYPGCEDPALNWTVTQTVHEKSFNVRMRVPNPAYTLDGEHLWVHEPNNPNNREFLDRYWEAKGIRRPPHTHLGGVYDHKAARREHYFRLPPVGQFDQISPMSILNRKETKSMIGPWWGDGGNVARFMRADPNTSTHVAMKNARSRANSMVEAVGADSVASAPEATSDGYMFGYNISQAHLLYPHFAGSFSELERTGRKIKIGPPMQSNATVAWMQWPKWRAEFNTTQKRMGHDPATAINNLAGDMLDVDAIPTNKTDQRLYYLGLDRPAPPAPLRPRPVQRAPANDPTNVNAQPQPVPAAEDIALDAEEDIVEELERPAPTTSDAPVGGNDVEMQNEVAARRERQGAQSNVLMDYGIPGMNLTDSINQEDEKKDFNRGQRAKHPDLEQHTLEQGKEKRNEDEENQHWFSSRHQPWAHNQLYEPAKLELHTSPMDEGAIKAYREKYGSDANLYLVNEDLPAKIDRIENSWGWLKRGIWDSRLDDMQTSPELHMQNLAKILCIYFDEHGVGEQVKFTEDQKRAGMEHGVYCHKAGGRKKAGKPFAGPLQDARVHNYVQIWPPVFSGEVKLSERAKNVFKDYCFARSITEWDKLEKQLKQANVWNELKRVQAPMKVREWVTTPWHYEYLPYRRQFSVFRDGETYSEGCLRCSRMFYDFEYMLAADRHTNKGAKHWPYTFWHPKKAPKTDHCRLAPLPFHSPELWSKTGKWKDAEQFVDKDRTEGGRAPDPRDFAPAMAAAGMQEAEEARSRAHVAPAARQDPDIRDAGQGDIMDWPAYQFKREFLHDDEYDNYERRKPEFARDVIARFRRYKNVAYTPGRPYTTICQGKMRNRGKTKFGDFEYRLQRSHKYGNICNDCAAVLDMAPGLFVRNHHYTISAGVVLGNEKQVARTPAQFWIGLQDRFGVNLDALHKPGHTVAEKDAASRVLHDFFRRQHIFPTAANGTPLTKLVSAPDIHLQKNMFEPERDPATIQEAIRLLNTFLAGGNVDVQKMRANKALFDILRAAERRYIHADTHKHIDPTKQFDSEVMRIENRNATVVVRGDTVTVNGGPPKGAMTTRTVERIRKAGSGTWYSCLVVSSYKPKNVMTNEYMRRSIKKLQDDIRTSDDVDQKSLMQAEIDEIRTKAREAYEIDIYLCTRKGSKGGETVTPALTQWEGDAYVTTYKNGKWVLQEGKPERQIRSMRQSRLFITYSLHRPVTSEVQGRIVLEKMADACYELFGNDKWLSRLLVFGQMIKSMKVGNQQGDQVSQSYFDVINHTNKTDAMKDFYGDKYENKSSYLYDTYETHVDKVEVDGGVEIGPKMKHPHFHMLLTINHFSYVQIDYFKMNAYLEIMFRGIEAGYGWGQRFFLDAGDGTPFYGDNENPYVDIRVYPQDNWKEVLAAYVRKNAVPSMMEAVSARGAPPRTAEWRRQVNEADGDEPGVAAAAGPGGLGAGGGNS